MSESRPVTHRRGFVTASGLSLLSLYGVWAALDAAPLPFLHRQSGDDHGGHSAMTDAAVDMPSHGEVVANDAAIAQFRRDTEEFVARWGLPDGSVRPRAADGPSDHSAHGAHDQRAAQGPGASPAAIDAYLLAFQWGFEPSIIRLDRDRPYRFRMMAVDVTHGAAMQLGMGSRITRLRRGVIVDQTMSFARPGELLLYCTVYCGGAHDRMMGRIIVT